MNRCALHRRRTPSKCLVTRSIGFAMGSAKGIRGIGVGSTRPCKGLIVGGASSADGTTLSKTRFRLHRGRDKGIMRGLMASGAKATADNGLPVTACGGKGMRGAIRCVLMRAGTPGNCRLDDGGRRVHFRCGSKGAGIVRVMGRVGGAGSPSNDAPAKGDPGAKSDAGV